MTVTPENGRAEQFSKFGIRYEATAKSKSEMYVDLLPLINCAPDRFA